MKNARDIGFQHNQHIKARANYFITRKIDIAQPKLTDGTSEILIALGFSLAAIVVFTNLMPLFV